MTKAAAGAADAEKSVEEAHTETVVAPEPNVKDAAAGSAVTAEPVPEESLPQIAELKEAEAETVEQEPTCGLCCPFSNVCTEPTPEVYTEDCKCAEDCWGCIELTPEVKKFAAVFFGRPGTIWPPQRIRIHWEEFEADMDENWVTGRRWRGMVNLMYELRGRKKATTTTTTTTLLG